MTLTACPGDGILTRDEHRTWRVLLIDAHCLFRQALRALLTSEGGVTVVGECGRVEEALQLIPELQADMVVTDLYLPDGGGAEFIQLLRTRFTKVAIVVLTAQRARRTATAARRAGALAYLLKNDGRGELSNALREVAAGRWYCSDIGTLSVTRARGDEATAASARGTYLTERQRQVLRSVALGHSTREIAAMLGVSIRAVHKHRERLRIALQLNSTAALTRFALREGLIPEGATGT
ncbi:MAG: response regulator transcription factor [Gammaproteobacteria bacterium]|nr:response regulator transcription factor [Gammaproteobacteria bacterium]